MTIVTTFYPIYDFTKEIVGDEGNVKLLIPAGTEPHDFEPSAKERAEISDADVFVYNSSDMEFFVDSLKDSVDSKQTLMIEAAKGIDRLESQEADEHEESEEGHDHAHEYDPHVWLDPVLAIKEVRTIAGELGEKYPDKRKYLRRMLMLISKSLKHWIKNTPKNSKMRQTAHSSLSMLLLLI